MSHKGWILLAVIGVVVIGIFALTSSSVKLGKSTGSTSTLGSVASIFKSSASIFGDVEKAFPSWFSSDGGGDTPSDADLNSYASTAGFASVPDYSA